MDEVEEKIDLERLIEEKYEAINKNVRKKSYKTCEEILEEFDQIYEFVGANIGDVKDLSKVDNVIEIAHIATMGVIDEYYGKEFMGEDIEAQYIGNITYKSKIINIYYYEQEVKYAYEDGEELKSLTTSELYVLESLLDSQSSTKVMGDDIEIPKTYRTLGQIDFEKFNLNKCFEDCEDIRKCTSFDMEQVTLEVLNSYKKKFPDMNAEYLLIRLENGLKIGKNRDEELDVGIASFNVAQNSILFRDELVDEKILKDVLTHEVGHLISAKCTTDKIKSDDLESLIHGGFASSGTIGVGIDEGFTECLANTVTGSYPCAYFFNVLVAHMMKEISNEDLAVAYSLGNKEPIYNLSKDKDRNIALIKALDLYTSITNHYIDCGKNKHKKEISKSSLVPNIEKELIDIFEENANYNIANGIWDAQEVKRRYNKFQDLITFEDDLKSIDLTEEDVEIEGFDEVYENLEELTLKLRKKLNIKAQDYEEDEL